MVNWNEMKLDERKDFCKRHGLSTHQTEISISVMEYAKNDIKWIKEYGNYGVFIDWLKNPLIELGEEELWQELESAYNE